jgi:hypothetical protein
MAENEPISLDFVPWEQDATTKEPIVLDIAPWDEPAQSEQSVIGSIARGAGAGVVDIVQGITETGAAFSDYAFGTDLNRDTTDTFEGVKTSLGFVPERTAGKIAELLVNYGSLAIPIGGWIGAAGKAGEAVRLGQTAITGATKLRRSAQAFGTTGIGKVLTGTRVSRAGTTAIATGLSDVLVAPSTGVTLADSWDAMPEYLRTTDETGLTGRELSATRLANKFKIGLEGAGFTLAGEAILPVVGAAVRGLSQVPGIPATARLLSSGMDALGSKLGQVRFVKKYLTPNGFTPREVFDAIGTAQNITEAEQQTASVLLSKYDSAIKNAVRLQRLTGRGKRALQAGYEDTTNLMTASSQSQPGLAQAFKTKYGSEALSAVQNMRFMVDDLSTRFEQTVLQAPNLTPQQQTALVQQFQSQQGSYLRRLYELHLNPEKFKAVNVQTLPQYQSARAQVAGILQRRNSQLLTGDADRQAGQIIDDIFDNTLLNGGLTAEAKVKQEAMAIAQGADKTVGRASLFRLADGMLKDRSQILDNAPLLREMMGEIRSPRDLFLRTVDDMSRTTASQKLFDSIPTLDPYRGGIKPLNVAFNEMNNGARPFVIDGQTVGDDMVEQLSKIGYVKLGDINPENAFGGAFGSLSGHYVPTEIYNSLTTPARAYSGIQDALAVSLQAKGMSQMAKTVLNPLSQIRNFLSNTFVIGANGLIGRNMGLFESADVLLSNAIKSPEQFKLLRAMTEEGAIGQNIQLNEMTQLLKEQSSGGVAAALQKGGNAFRKSSLGAPVRFMENTYRLGDDYWKVVGALGEKARYSGAFRKAGLDLDNLSSLQQQALVDAGLARRTSSIAGTDFSNLFAIDLVRSTMPTYSMVPEAIKALRKIPIVGNFMSFPAEIIRTSGNIVNRGVKELGFKATTVDQAGNLVSKIPGMTVANARALERQVRAIGAQRLSGYTAMALVAPGQMINAAHSVLGITEQEEEMLAQSAPYWTKGNSLMYLEKPNEKGQADAIDLSYMLPYEFMLSPARAALETYAKKGEVDSTDVEKIGAAAWEAFKKFAEPFASESLAAERVIDVTTRGGRTQTGAEIYEPGALWGDQISKSVNHVVGAFIPGIVDQLVTVKGGEFVPGRVTRSVTGMPSTVGDAYTVAEEAGTMLTGLRPMKIDFARSLGYAGGEYSGLRSSASQIFTSLADNNDATADDVINAFVDANEARKSHMANLYVKIQKALDSGMSKSEVRKAFDNSGVTKKELNAIMRNKYTPLEPSRGLLREIRNEVNVKEENRILQRLPMPELRGIIRELRNTPLVGNKEPIVLDVVPWEQDNVAPQPQVQAAPQSVPQAAPQQAAPQPAIPTTRPANAPVPSALMGGNPFDQLRNMEIFQRLQGQ